MGNYRNGSDIDLAIVSTNDFNYQQLMNLETEIDDLLLPYKIDITVKNKIINTDLVAHIENAGKIFYDRAAKLVFNESPVDYRVRVKK